MGQCWPSKEGKCQFSELQMEPEITIERVCILEFADVDTDSEDEGHSECI